MIQKEIDVIEAELEHITQQLAAMKFDQNYTPYLRGRRDGLRWVLASLVVTERMPEEKKP